MRPTFEIPIDPLTRDLAGQLREVLNAYEGLGIPAPQLIRDLENAPPEAIAAFIQNAQVHIFPLKETIALPGLKNNVPYAKAVKRNKLRMENSSHGGGNEVVVGQKPG